ncbi:substrate-binding periplasmic protein [Vibrio zhanjiangensis]|uniref:substrate-binding periplasmic protein n=1 Tax=Vibrio zhanjiangensis TaxID=1046128 RepID=UPI0024E18473|nr:transporter substrate-binding domain-containing protein [Vibrio zhanjiangensis]
MKALTISLLVLIYSQIAQGKNLVIGVENIDYYPISSIKSGQYTGYARDLLDQFAKDYHHTLTYRALPIVRLYDEFIEQEVDLKFPDNPNWGSTVKKDTQISYSQSALSYTEGVVVLTDKLGQSKPKTIGIVRGFTPHAIMEDVDQGKLKIKEFNSLRNLVKVFVNRNDIDGMYFNVAIMKYTIKSLEIDEDMIAYDPAIPHIDGDYFLSSITHTDIIKQFDDFLQKNASLVQKLKEKYGLN